MPSARDIAVEALANRRPGEVFLQDRLDRLIERAGLSESDASLATELSLGVCRHRLTLDRLIGRVFHGHLRHLDPRLLTILRVGLYQLVWLERVPAFAAVHTAAEQAGQAGGRKASGLVNALLREVLRHLDERVHTEPPENLRRSLQVDRSRWRVLDMDWLPDPVGDPAGFLSTSTSHPRWLVERWLGNFGLGPAGEICLAGSLRPPLVLRANRLRTTPQGLVDRLAADGITAALDAEGRAVFVLTAPPVRRIAAVTEGLCQPQDRTSQWVVRTCAPRPGQNVLDLCAGPGTKTTQLAEEMSDRGLILACDVSSAKLDLLKDNCRRMGVSCARTVRAEALDNAAEEYGPFDMALVDAPCSNTGVLARRVEARYRLKPAHLNRLAQEQHHLLTTAARHVAKGGTLVYSTCSIEPEENEHVVQRFLTGSPAWQFIDSRLILPSAGEQPTDWCDGGFVAVLRRSTG